LLLLPAILFPLASLAWSNVIPGSGRSSGIGNAYVSQSGLDAALFNQAGLANIQSPQFTAYFENRYLIKDLSSRGISVGIPVQGGVLAAGLSAFGPVKWMENTLSLSFAKKLSPNLSAGIRINYFGIKLPEENQHCSSVGAEAGIIWKFSPILFAGIHFANPFSISFQTLTYTEKVPYRINLGGHAFITDKIIIAAEAEKIENQNIILKAGLEWEASGHFYIRGGYNSGPSKLYTGIGFNYRFITVDFAFSYHQALGVTPFTSIRFEIK